MKKLAIILTCLLLAASLQTHAVGVPNLMTYQGRLTGLAEGTVSVNLEFNIYDASTGGVRIWGPQTFSAVSLDEDGRFTVFLGPEDTEGDPLKDAFTAADRYIEIKVNDETITPRQQILSVPYAMNAPRPTGTTIDNPLLKIDEVNETVLMPQSDERVGIALGYESDGSPVQPDMDAALHVNGKIRSSGVDATTIETNEITAHTFRWDDGQAITQAKSFKLLAASFDYYTDKIRFTITQEGITPSDITTAGVNPRIFPIFTDTWPDDNQFTQILFEVRNLTEPDYCIGGGDSSLSDTCNNKCTSYLYEHTGGLKKGKVENDDWIRLTVVERYEPPKGGPIENLTRIQTCPVSVPELNEYVGQGQEDLTEHFPGRRIDGDVRQASFCLYSKSPNDVDTGSPEYTWRHRITKILVEEFDCSDGHGHWEWKLWYK